MTGVTPEAVTAPGEPRPAFLARWLASLLLRLRAREDLRTTVARSIDEAFAGFHREMR